MIDPKFWLGRRVFLTGHTGFKGSWLAFWLTNLGAKVIGFACIIDRSNKKNLKIKQKIISHMKIDVPTFTKNKLTITLRSLPITKPGSRYVR